jgi:hypothetical protein
MPRAANTTNDREFAEAVDRTAGLQLGPLGNVNQVIMALGKTIRAMAAGEIDSQTGARICNALGIMRTCFETIALDRIEERLHRLEDPMAQPRESAETAQEAFQ